MVFASFENDYKGQSELMVSVDSNPMFSFIGVSTRLSSIMRVFPHWMADLGRTMPLVGIDLPLHAPAQQYREVLAGIKDDPNQVGGLVTTHKLDLYAAGWDLFDEVDSVAHLCGEVSCISKHGARLVGYAKDPITAGLSLTEFVPVNYWQQTGGAVLCLGAGGAALAISLHLLTNSAVGNAPSRLTLTDVSAARLAHAQQIHTQLARSRVLPVAVDYVQVSPHDSSRVDGLLRDLPEGSLLINATGMGKDRPGSPIGADAVLPRRGLIWELNYRGKLDFLKQAEAQRNARELQVQDGWRYFLHGWTQVIEEVLHIQLSEAQFAHWAQIAAQVR